MEDDGDCDDADSEVNPLIADAICEDGLDQNCDGVDACAVSGTVEVDAVALWSGAGSILGGGGDINQDGFDEALIGDADQDTVTVIWSIVDGEVATTNLQSEPGWSFGLSVAALGDTFAIAAPDADCLAAGVGAVVFTDSGMSNPGIVYGDCGDRFGDVSVSGFGEHLIALAAGGWLASYYDLDSDGPALAGFDTYPQPGDEWLAKEESLCTLDLEDATDVFTLANGKLLPTCGETLAVGVGTAGIEHSDTEIETYVDWRILLYCCEGAACCEGGADSIAPQAAISIGRTSNLHFIDGAVAILSDAGTLAVGQDNNVYLFSISGTDMDIEDVAAALLGEVGEEFGSAIASAGDMNGDGYDELAVGAPGAGLVYIYLGPIKEGVEPTLLGTVEGSPGLGVDLFSPGDMTGDGASELLALGYYDVGVRAYVIPGGSAQ